MTKSANSFQELSNAGENVLLLECLWRSASSDTATQNKLCAVLYKRSSKNNHRRKSMNCLCQETEKNPVQPEEIARLLRSIGASGRLIGFKYVVFIVFMNMQSQTIITVDPLAYCR